MDAYRAVTNITIWDASGEQQGCQQSVHAEELSVIQISTLKANKKEKIKISSN